MKKNSPARHESTTAGVLKSEPANSCVRYVSIPPSAHVPSKGVEQPNCVKRWWGSEAGGMGRCVRATWIVAHRGGAYRFRRVQSVRSVLRARPISSSARTEK